MNLSFTGKTAGIVAEYNPFHNGHARHIARTRELTGAENIVVIMSGNFVQRGDCAVGDKFSRARMALQGGADLVIELPLPFACAGAETFARGGVGLADALGQVDFLSFGMECDRYSSRSGMGFHIQALSILTLRLLQTVRRMLR